MKNLNDVIKTISESFDPVFLVGFMGSGKTYTGQLLAKKTERKFIDLDTYIFEKNQKTITEIFEYGDEHLFRIIEQKALLKIVQKKNTIVATGGGAACSFDNMQLMNQHGITIYIKTSPEVLYERLLKNKGNRPLISNKNDDSLYRYILRELPEREKFYNEAKIILQDIYTK